jgi:hypothetical protein
MKDPDGDGLRCVNRYGLAKMALPQHLDEPIGLTVLVKTLSWKELMAMILMAIIIV